MDPRSPSAAPAPSCPLAATPAARDFAPAWRLEHSYARLPAVFHAGVAPTPVSAPRLVIFNRALAVELGLPVDELAGAASAEIFSGNRLPPGAAPLAQAYAGHQYGHFTTLGDGRAILLGEQRTPAGAWVDVQLKGSGPTPFSRRGDGRAALGPMLREHVISEAMHALGIPTTRSLAVVATGEDIYRPEPRPGAVLTRIAASHLRVGTFEWAAARGDGAALDVLVDYALRRHFPERVGEGNAARALLDAVIGRQATLLAQWMGVGFVHGVMNTDNMAISGETIDYGPCAFIDAYDPATVFSSIDRHGRYAYGQQPRIAQWNLARLAEALLPALHPEQAEALALANDLIGGFATRFEAAWLTVMRRKLGLANAEPEDRALVDALLAWMERTRADFTNTFARLAADESGAVDRPDAAGEPDAVRVSSEPELSAAGAAQPGADAEFAAWRERWRARLARQPLTGAEAAALRRASSPAVIPRNHLVEAALAAAERGDLGPLEALLAVLARPFDHGAAGEAFRQPASAGGAPYRTFCGT